MTIAGLSPRQEKFAREYVKTGVGALAARKAGYSSKSRGDTVQASRLLANDSISDAVKILRQRQAERLDISRETLINNTAHIAEQAAANQEFGASIAATTLIMKAQGYLVERSMNMSVDVTQSHLTALQEYTDQRIDAALANHRATLAGHVNGQVETSAGVVVDADVSNAHCTPSEDRSMGVMTNDTHVDSTDDATR